MSVVRSLWASIQGDPVIMRRVNGWLTIFWIVMIPVSILTGWISSVTYVAALSLWALVSGHWSAWQAARVEVKQAEESEERERPEAAERENPERQPARVRCELDHDPGERDVLHPGAGERHHLAGEVEAVVPVLAEALERPQAP